MKIIEFREKYPHYNEGFIAKNPLTETEKLIGKKSCLTHDVERKRTYQDYFVKEAVLNPLLEFCKDGAKSFTCKGVEFVGVTKGDSVVAVCIPTKERVMFSLGFTIEIEK